MVFGNRRRVTVVQPVHFAVGVADAGVVDVLVHVLVDAFLFKLACSPMRKGCWLYQAMQLVVHVKRADVAIFAGDPHANVLAAQTMHDLGLKANVFGCLVSDWSGGGNLLLF